MGDTSGVGGVTQWHGLKTSRSHRMGRSVSYMIFLRGSRNVNRWSDITTYYDFLKRVQLRNKRGVELKYKLTLISGIKRTINNVLLKILYLSITCKQPYNIIFEICVKTLKRLTLTFTNLKRNLGLVRGTHSTHISKIASLVNVNFISWVLIYNWK